MTDVVGLGDSHQISRDGSESSIKKGHIEVSEDSASDNLLYDVGDFNINYLKKTVILSRGIDEIGFGRYQIGLIFVAGFGWLADNAWPVVTSLILPALHEINGVHPPTGKGPYLVLAQNLGLLAGAAFWSLSSDIIGRRWAFNLTFLITGVWAVIAGASPNFAALGVFVAFWSFGVGGNLPVDLAILLEALPSSKQWILTVMSAWWSLGQLLANLLAWALITNYSCASDDTTCQKNDNKGWRYFLFTMGGLTLAFFIARFSFRVFESPRFYVAKGKDALAIETLNKIAKINRSSTSVTIADLNKVDELYPIEETNNQQILENKLKKFDFSHIKQCFGSKKLAILSTLVILTWSIIGLAFPLYNAFLPTLLASKGNAGQPLSVYLTYRNSLIIAVIGIPGALLAGLLVELKIGRKGTLILSLIFTGIFLFVSTTATTSNAYLGLNCGFSFFSNIMYGVLYAYTPEIFPTKIRGTGVGLAATGNRILGVFSPIIAIYANLETSAPVYVSGALFLLSGVLVVFFPYEPRGHSSL